jgi:hypothetical protein
MKPAVLLALVAGLLVATSPVVWADDEDFEDLNKELLDEEDDESQFGAGAGAPPEMDEVRGMLYESHLWIIASRLPTLLTRTSFLRLRSMQRMKEQQKVIQHILSTVSETCRTEIISLLQLPPEEQQGKVCGVHACSRRRLCSVLCSVRSACLPGAGSGVPQRGGCGGQRVTRSS